MPPAPIWCSCKRCMAATNTMPSATPPGRKPRNTNFSPTACGHSSPTGSTLPTPWRPWQCAAVKFPIRTYDNLDVSVHGDEERGLLHCQLEVPGHEQLHAICVHLGLRENHRQRQVSLLMALLESLPPEELVIVAGDFNDWRLKADARLSEHLIEAFGKPARSFPARLPLLRLDRIYLRNAQTCKARVLSSYPGRTSPTMPHW